jgi:DNA methylase
MKPYYQDDLVTLYCGDCRDITGWLTAAVLVTDPPYGRNSALNGGLPNPHGISHGNPGCAGDDSTAVRDQALAMWGTRPAVVFGDLMLAPPPGTQLTAIYHKPPDAGVRGAVAGFRRDAEAIYLMHGLPAGIGGRTSIITTGARNVGNPGGLAARYGHPHAKPVDVMETLIAACPPGTVADPFTGAGSTLIAARNLGRPAIGIELDPAHCRRTAERLTQPVLITGTL